MEPTKKYELLVKSARTDTDYVTQMRRLIADNYNPVSTANILENRVKEHSLRAQRYEPPIWQGDLASGDAIVSVLRNRVHYAKFVPNCGLLRTLTENTKTTFFDGAVVVSDEYYNSLDCDELNITQLYKEGLIGLSLTEEQAGNHQVYGALGVKRETIEAIFDIGKLRHNFEWMMAVQIPYKAKKKSTLMPLGISQIKSSSFLYTIPIKKHECNMIGKHV